jgi:hypothetical protein
MYLMTAPTIAPATASGSSGHQGGVPRGQPAGQPAQGGRGRAVTRLLPHHRYVCTRHRYWIGPQDVGQPRTPVPETRPLAASRTRHPALAQASRLAGFCVKFAHAMLREEPVLFAALRCAVRSPVAVRPVGGRLRESLVQAGEVGDHAVHAGDRENAEDADGGNDQQQGRYRDQGSPTVIMRVEGWVSSPEPAVGGALGGPPGDLARQLRQTILDKR